MDDAELGREFSSLVNERAGRTPTGGPDPPHAAVRTTDADGTRTHGQGGPVMRALVFGGPRQRSWTEVPDPQIIDPGDAIIQVDTATICGTDLHILGGDVPAVQPGRILGHEAVGTVVAVGSAVATVRPGDRVLASCISACGRCRYCREGSYGQCRGGGGWILGHLVDGVQAQYARLPFADLSTYPLPEGITDEAAVLLADILPTSYEVGVLNGQVRPGDTVVVVGTGPIGLAGILTARLFSPAHIVAVDKADSRLQAAKQIGADVAVKADDDPLEVVRAITDGLGADVVMEAVGTPASFELCTTLVRPGGRVANIGVHGKPATLHLEDLWTRNVTITTGLVDTYSTPTLLKMVSAGQLDTGQIITHRFPLGDIMQAYDVFSRPADTGALKVALSRE
ncbi:zinc-dependent alcohol dehydrogenase family protein [Micromonospora sp. NBC_00898]|uniref:zinc-dependent alcohol dehydrogenase family protein n=1 Tax=Micromonospora sp. NBC_00898 TaxID=2975981 RepID=UPI0038657F6E|nr:zinc-dependent alcohol dehydrogenase family protein [Micromonospora sp. NBC_00898]